MLKKPSELCGGCKLYEEQCHCLCHTEDMASGYHEIIWHEKREIKIVHPEND